MEEKAEIREVSEREVWVEEERLCLGEDNIFYVTSDGAVDEKMAIKIKEITLKFMRMAEGKMHLLIDLNKAGKQSLEARKTWDELSEHEKCGKVALFGLHPVARVIASFAMGISKKKDMRFFKTKEDALAWLKEEVR